MTPFGLKLRELRARKHVTQKEMAKAIGVSAAYLSALERGHRGQPSWQFVQKVITYFNVIWDEADALQKLSISSHTRVIVDTEALGPMATELSNVVAEQIKFLSEGDCKALIREINARAKQPNE